MARAGGQRLPLLLSRWWRAQLVVGGRLLMVGGGVLVVGGQALAVGGRLLAIPRSIFPGPSTAKTLVGVHRVD